MYFNTTSDTMFVYGSGGWVPAGSSVNGTSQRYKYVATSGQTSFSGTDANGNTLTYDAGFIDVYLNGVHLDPTDYTATTGTSIVLGSGAALNDELYIVAFGTFNVASFNGSGLDDNTVNISKLNATGTRSAATALRGDNTFADITPTEISDQANTSTGYMMMPVGTTGQRPGSPASGMYRMNSTTGEPEWYDSVYGIWVAFASNSAYNIDFLVVAGGGAGGGMVSGFCGAGGGAGGYRSSSETAIPLTAYTVTVGAGGSGVSSGQGNNGSNSVFNTTTSTGGGGGGTGVTSGTGSNGSGGGSGGGGATGSGTPGTGGSGGAGTSGQGFAGGSAPNHNSNDTNIQGGGGGGAGGVGGNGTSGGPAGNGGVGLNWQSLGTFYAGGGGGSSYNTATPGSGGNGGGGNGGNFNSGTTGQPGTANRGGGGGGAGVATTGGSGGSGVVIVRYLGAQRGSGGTVTSAGGYTYHTFTSSGTFTA
jgi:hypothetical protein